MCPQDQRTALWWAEQNCFEVRETQGGREGGGERQKEERGRERVRGRARGGQGLAKRAVGGPVIDMKGLCARNRALSHVCVHARLFRCSYDLCVLHVCCGVSVRSYLWVRERETERETEREKDYQRSNSVRDRLRVCISKATWLEYFESNFVVR